MIGLGRAILGIVVALSALLPMPLAAQEDADAAVAAMGDYLDFATYGEGVIRPEQLTPEIAAEVVFVDTRRAEDFAAGHIAGARHVDWRELLRRRGELPDDRTVVLYCQTGVLSAQATFALRVAGHDNVLVLQEGFDGWRRGGGPIER